jgi:hypothetical protein
MVVVRRRSGVEHCVPRAHVDLYFDQALQSDDPPNYELRPLPAQLQMLNAMLSDVEDV